MRNNDLFKQPSCFYKQPCPTFVRLSIRSTLPLLIDYTKFFLDFYTLLCLKLSPKIFSFLNIITKLVQNPDSEIKPPTEKFIDSKMFISINFFVRLAFLSPSKIIFVYRYNICFAPHCYLNYFYQYQISNITNFVKSQITISIFSN